MKTIRAKFQIKPNIYVNCYVEVEDVSDDDFRAYVGIKRRADTIVPVGAKILFNPSSMNPESRQIASDLKGEYEEISVTVLKHFTYSGDDQAVHICTPLQRNKRPEQRRQRRKTCNFILRFDDEHIFRVENGTTDGLMLFFQAKNPITNMALDTEYMFQAEHKGHNFRFPAVIKHVLYNWKTHEHRLGIAFQSLDRATEMALNVMLDPNFKLDLSMGSVDTESGKITGH